MSMNFRRVGVPPGIMPRPMPLVVPPGIRPPSYVPPGIRPMGEWTEKNTQTAWTAVSTVSSVASIYHGYKRNNSVGWALWWGFMGALFPIITPTIAVAQGYGKRATR